MEKNDKHIKLAQWFEGKLSDEEINSLKKDFDLEAMKKNLDKVDFFDYPSMDTDEQFEKILAKQNRHKGEVRRLFPVFLKIAAAIVILLIPAWFLYQKSQITTISTQLAEQKHITLPDGSEVSLNAETTISYSDNKWATERMLDLTGEAYFKVKKGATFTVKTKTGEVVVIGTQFNVFNRKKTLRVVCYEGKVKVKTSRIEQLLVKGKGIEVRNNQPVLFDEKPTDKGWVSGNIKFHNAPLKEVFEELERQFEIKIQPTDVDTNRKFKGELPNDNLEMALKILSKTMGLRYEEMGDGMVRIF